MLRTRPQTGITLIALIITIIVMLILVGVTINVALNGRLFEQAQTAANDTQMNADKEQLLSAVVGAIGTDAKVDFSKLDSNLPSGWTGSNGTYTSPRGNVFTVDEKGNITSGSGNGGTSEEDSQVPEELAKYILGQDLKGRVICDYNNEENGIINMNERSEMRNVFKQDPTDLNSKIHENVKFSYTDNSSESDEYEYIYGIRYGRDVYEFKTIYIYEDEYEEEKTIEGSLKKVNSPEGNLGKYVKYKGITWIVLYDDSEKVELISANALGEVTLGGSDFNTAKDSYNEAIKTLTDACKAATGITTGIRNVGGPAEDPKDLENVTLADIKNKGINLTTEQEAAVESLITEIKQEDENYLKDYNQMKDLGILATDVPKDYFLASRGFEDNGIDFYYGPRYVTYDADTAATYNLCNYIYKIFMQWKFAEDSANVRPVCCLPSGSLSGLSGAGTNSDPLILN